MASGHLTPHAYESLVDLGTWMPFAKAAQELKRLLGVTVSEPTARRYAEAAGAAYEGVQSAEVVRIEKMLPEAPAGPAKQLLSVDGAMVPLVGGEWAEVKTLVLGEIQAPVKKEGQVAVHTAALSYFSRLTDATTFGQLALVETHRRGVEKAHLVAAVTDGAEWEQGFIDFHRPDAVRILDFAHTAEHLSAVGEAIWGQGTPATAQWFEQQLAVLKQQGPDPMLAELHALQQTHPSLHVLTSTLAYLEKRQKQIQYPDYLAQGLPIGSGAVESGNKLVVEARLKGAGMHWARSHVNPMLALRNIACNDRWTEAWPAIVAQAHDQAAQRQRQRRQQRPPLPNPLPAIAAQHPPAAPVPALAIPLPSASTGSPPCPATTKTPALPHRPAANHPWRCSPIGKAIYQSSSKTTAKN